MNKIAAIGAGVILIAIGAYALMTPKTAEGPQEPAVSYDRTNPTNFVDVGVVVFDNPGLKPGVPYFVYEEPGAPALTKELKLDAFSVCSFANGAAPCMALSVTLDRPLGGKTAVIEGEADADSILIRKIRVLDEGEEPRLPAPGSVFISWPNAIEMIRNCEVEMAMQTHTLDIYLTLKDGTRLRAVEPMIDEVFRFTQEATATCGSIGVATE